MNIVLLIIQTIISVIINNKLLYKNNKWFSDVAKYTWQRKYNISTYMSRTVCIHVNYLWKHLLTLCFCTKTPDRMCILASRAFGHVSGRWWSQHRPKHLDTKRINIDVSKEPPNTSHNIIQRYRHLFVVQYLPEDRSAATRPKKASGQPRRTPSAAAVIVKVLFDDIIMTFIRQDYVTLKYNNIPNTTLLCEKRWTTLKASRYVCVDVVGNIVVCLTAVTKVG